MTRLFRPLAFSAIAIALLVTLLDAQSAQAVIPPLEVGAAVIDITPPEPYRMSGYFYERLSTGTHDPLYARALVMRQGQLTTVLIVCDLIGVGRELTAEARSQIAEKLSIDDKHIVIGATHSHTGPLYGGVLLDWWKKRKASASETAQPEFDYPKFLIERLVAVAAKANQKLTVSTMEFATGSEQTISFNRRFVMQDGSVRFNPGKLNPQIVRVAGPIDPDVGFLLFRSDDKVQASLVNFALHLDTVGGTEFSADYPKYVHDMLEAKFGKQCVSLFGLGCCGDINHIDVSHNRPQKGHEEAERIGNRLAETIAASLAKTESNLAPRLVASMRVVDVPVQTYSDEQIAKAKEQLPLVGTNQIGFLEQVEATKIVDLATRYQGKPLAVRLNCFAISRDVAIVCLPGEVFSELGLAIKAKSPFKQTLVLELCNDSPAYIPTKKAFVEGSYEVVNSRIATGGGEMLVDESLEMLQQLRQAVDLR